jgi:type I restriction enzyme R subunit
MLDTGIDVPEVVNLVFAKPVKSYVKFWQMIGRGTRLRKDLFGPGKDKTEFLIFDHWQNFWFFDEKYKEAQPAPQKSLLQHLFEARVELLSVAIDKMDEAAIGIAEQQILGDIRAVRDTNAIDARDKWKELTQLADGDRVHHFAAATKADLLSIVAPLQHLRSIRGDEDAYRFDLLMTRLQIELLKGGPSGPKVQDLKGRVEEAVELLGKNLQPVKAKAESIKQVRRQGFWGAVEVQHLEGLRSELRSVMKYQQLPTTTRVAPQVFDVTDDGHVAQAYIPKLEGLDLVEYRARVERVLKEHFAKNPVLQRIRAGQTVQEAELEDLARSSFRSTTRPTSRTSPATTPRPGARCSRCSVGWWASKPRPSRRPSPPSSTSTRACRRSSSASCRCCRTTSPRTAASSSSACTSRRSPPSTPRAWTASSTTRKTSMSCWPS